MVAPVLKVKPYQLAYQNVCTFRVSSPRNTPMGVPHRDYDYFHQPAELNIWVPLTRVFGTNTLYSESVPKLGDFHPFELERGQAVLFWGNQCQHYTVANDSNWTRVSFDIRVVLLEHFDRTYIDQRNKPTHFKLNQYYQLCSKPREDNRSTRLQAQSSPILPHKDQEATSN